MRAALITGGGTGIGHPRQRGHAAVVDTALAHTDRPDFHTRKHEMATAYPLKRLGVPDDVGSVVAFLLSDDAAWMTGQTLVIDGGLLLAGGV